MRLDLPEHGQLDLPLAGLGSRGLAAMIDFVILLAGIAGLFVLVAGVSDSVAPDDLVRPGVFAVVSLGPVVGPLGLELFWRGQTPGKRLLNLRVLGRDGRIPTGAQLLLRNVLRLIDFLPLGYVLGTVAVFVTAEAQRLGDLVAGTVVIREDPAAIAELAAEPRRTNAILAGVPAEVLEAARLLVRGDRALEPEVFRARRTQLLALTRRHRPDLQGADDDAVWQELLKEHA